LDDTLVVTVTGQSDQTWFDRSGNYHSAALKVTERYTLQNAHVMEYVLVMENVPVLDIRLDVLMMVGEIK